MRLHKPRLPLRWMSMLVLVGFAAASVALALVIGSIERDQQHRLLIERSKEAADLVAGLPRNLESALPLLAVDYQAKDTDPALFTAEARTLIGAGTTAVGAERVSGGMATVLAVAGQGPAAGSTLSGERAVLAREAAAAKGMVSGVLAGPGGEQLEFALRSGSVIMFEDAAIDPSKSIQAGPNQPFSELDGALYASAQPQRSTLVLTTTEHLPLSGTLARLPIQVGAGRWLLVTHAKTSLIGSLATDAPWAVLGAGLIATILTATLVETLVRRRSYALALVAQRTAALHDATETAEKANRSKSEFLSRMSHELRTPLNAVLGFAQLLEMDQLSASQQESVGQIIKGGRHLVNLIDEVLDISRIDSGTLAISLEPVVVNEIIDDTLALMRPMADRRRIHIELACPPEQDACVSADRQRLKQILLNLLSNAVKYNRDNGTVTVSCETFEPGQLRVTVSDTGPGISASDLNRLFVPFERLGAERTDIEGTGVGLALSRRLAEAMGGTIGVESVEGQGSRFWVQLLLAANPLHTHDLVAIPAEAPAGEDPEPDSRRKILYIEDNPANVTLIERLLSRRHDLEIIPAIQGSIGLALAHEHRPAAIMLDLHLPDMDGHHLLRQLRDNPLSSAIPVIIVSADATQRQIDRLLQAGANAYLTKPINLQELLDTLDALLAPAQTP